MNKYQKAISVTEHYRETKSRFTWIGEIEDENLLSALEKLSDDDLEILTLYIYEGYSTVELSKVYVDPMGKRIRPDFLSQHFPDFLVAHQMKRIRFHDLRQSALCQWREPEGDSGVAGSQRHQHNKQHLYTSGFLQ